MILSFHPDRAITYSCANFANANAPPQNVQYEIGKADLIDLI